MTLRLRLSVHIITFCYDQHSATSEGTHSAAALRVSRCNQLPYHLLDIHASCNLNLQLGQTHKHMM